MSEYKFIASDGPLPEIDLRGFVKMKAREYKSLNKQTQGLVQWDNIDDDAEVLYAEDESTVGGLIISLCKNPPYGLEDYINKKFIYWLRGNFQLECLNQLHEYIKDGIPKGNNVEIWSIWFGDGKQEIKRRKLKRTCLEPSDLEFLKSMNCCISIE